MAASGVELARAFVTIVPSFEGAQGTIAQQLIPGAGAAGDGAGKAMGGSLMGSFKAAAAPLLTGAALVGAGVGLYKLGEVFDDVTDTIRTGTGATGDALDGLVDSAKNVGTKVPAEFSNIGPVVADLNTRLGLTGPTLEKVASQYLEAGRILGEEIDINKTSAAFTAFKISGEGVSGAMDDLFRVSQATGMGMNELAAGAQQVSPALQTLGFSFQDSISLIGSLDKAGLNSTQVMASMSKSLVTLAKDGEEPQAAFKRVTGELKGFIDKGDEAGALDLAGKVFGTRGATQFIGAIKEGTLSMDDLMGATGATGDTILGVGEDTADFAEKWQLVKNKALLALEPLGSAVFEALGDALGAVMPALDALAKWMSDNPALMKVIVIGLGAFAAALAVAAVAQWAMNAALLANPITWIIVGVVALVAAIVALVANWDTVVAWIRDVWGACVEWLAGTWQSIVDTATDAWNSFTEWLAGIWESITSTISDTWNSIVEFFAGIWESITGTVTDAWNSIVEFISGIPQRIFSGLNTLGALGSKALAWFGGVFESAKTKLGELLDFVKGIPGKITSTLGNLGSLLINAGRDIMQGLLDGISAMWQSVKNKFSELTSWIPDWKGPPATDKVLLRANGRLVIDGFIDGLEDEFGAVESTLQRLTSDLPGYAAEVSIGATVRDGTTPGARSDGSPVTININEINDADGTAMAVARSLQFAMAV